jgi:hypothetical protein
LRENTAPLRHAKKFEKGLTFDAKFGILCPHIHRTTSKHGMKLTTPLKAFLSLAILAGAASTGNAASLSLGAGGLTELHGAAPGTLVYTDPSGIKISFAGQPHTSFVNVDGSRGWNNDQFDPIGGAEIFAAVGDHIALTHFGGPELVTIDFTSATDVIPGTVSLSVYDLDAPTISTDESWTITDGGLGAVLTSAGGLAAGGPFGGGLTHTQALDIAGGIVTITPSQNAGTTTGISGFNLSFQVPEPATGMLALLGGCSLLFLRRRR